MTGIIIIKTALSALVLNYGVHYGSSIAYMKLCVPQDIWGFVQSLATTSSPLCSTLLSTMQVTQNNYAVVLTTTIGAAIANLIKP